MRRSAILHGIKLTAFVVARGFVGLVLGLTLWSLLPLALHWTPTVVMSGSMESNIMTGDIAIASPITQKEISEGHILRGHVLLAKDPAAPETLFTHRVIRLMDDGTYMTKGDANAQADKIMLPPENILGIERLRIPYIGLVLKEAKEGNFLLPVLFVALFVCSLLLTQTDRERHKRLSLEKNDSMAGVLSDAPKKPKKGALAVFLVIVASGSVNAVTSAEIGSQAFFSAQTATAQSSFTTSTAFPYISPYSKTYSYSNDFTSRFNISGIQSAQSAGVIPSVSWEPKSTTVGADPNAYKLNRIIAGDHDVYLQSVASHLISSGSPTVAVHLFPGANNISNPWSEKSNGNNGKYVEAWVHVVDMFKAKGVKNVEWIWSVDAPVSVADDMGKYYPGSAYVTATSLNVSAFTSAGNPSASSPEALMGLSLNALNTLAPDKKIIVVQSDTSPASPTATQAKWLSDIKSYLSTHQKVSGTIGF